MRRQDLEKFYRIPPDGQPRPREGMLLLAEPFMRDFVFRHSVVLIVSVSEKDVLGIRLDLPPLAEQSLSHIIPEFKNVLDFDIGNGGPVGRDTLFFLHTYPDVKNSSPVLPGLWVNGDFEQMKQIVLQDPEREKHIRFFLGYAGWTPRQLQDEIERGQSWILGAANAERDVFAKEKNMWVSVMAQMGRKYEVCSRFPTIPIMN